MRLGAKDDRISIRVSKDLSNWISDRSRLSGMNESDFIRFILEDFRRTVQIAERVATVISNDESTTIDN